MAPRWRVVWISLSVFFLTTALLFGLEGLFFLFGGGETLGPSGDMMPLMFFVTGLMFFATGAVFLLYFESKRGHYVQADDPQIGFANALAQLPHGVVAVFLGVLLALPVLFIWGPNKHWALSFAAACTGEESPPSQYNHYCQNLARAAIMAGAETEHVFPFDGLMPLGTALAAQNMPMVYLLLDQGADVNHPREDGLSPMFDVVDNMELFQLFVEKGGRTDVMDSGGRTLLWYAAARGDLPVARKLIALGNPIDRGDQSGVTPLMVAVKAQDQEMMRSLVRMGANVNARNKNGATVLMMAARQDFLPGADFLLTKRANVHARMSANSSVDPGMSALDMAISGGNTEMVRLLLLGGAPVNAEMPGQNSPLIRAVAESKLEIVELLLGRGADVNHFDPGGWTALHWAAQSPDTDQVMMRLLLRYHPNVHARGVAPNESSNAYVPGWNRGKTDMPRHWTPLHLAAMSGNWVAVQELLGAGADPNAMTGDLQSPLSVGARPGGLESTLVLLNRGAQPNFPGQLESPLHLAAKNKALDVARALVGGGASLAARNGKGKTPLDVAMAHVPVEEQPTWMDLLSKPKNI